MGPPKPDIFYLFCFCFVGEFRPLPKKSRPNPLSYIFLYGVHWAPRKFGSLPEEILATLLLDFAKAVSHDTERELIALKWVCCVRDPTLLRWVRIGLWKRAMVVGRDLTMLNLRWVCHFYASVQNGMTCDKSSELSLMPEQSVHRSRSLNKQRGSILL